MGDFLRLSPWSGGLDQQAQVVLAHFVPHCESCVQDVENVVLVIRVCCCSFLRERKKTVLPHFVFFP